MRRRTPLTVGVELDVDRAISFQPIEGTLVVTADEGASHFCVFGFLGIRQRPVLVACSHDDDASRSCQLFQEFCKEPVVFVKIGRITLAERCYARFVVLLGIVEEIFESQGVCGCRVFIVVDGIDVDDVAADGIAHQTDITFVSHTAIVAVEAAACCDAQRMGAVRLCSPIGGTLMHQYFSLSHVVTSHRQLTVDGVLRQHVPDSADAIAAHRLVVVEIGVSQVEADVHQPHDDTLAGESPMLGSRLINR